MKKNAHKSVPLSLGDFCAGAWLSINDAINGDFRYKAVVRVGTMHPFDVKDSKDNSAKRGPNTEAAA